MRRPRPQSDEPVPASVDYEDQRAGELQIGSYFHTWMYDRDRKLPPKKHPFGFQAPERP